MVYIASSGRAARNALYKAAGWIGSASGALSRSSSIALRLAWKPLVQSASGERFRPAISRVNCFATWPASPTMPTATGKNRPTAVGSISTCTIFAALLMLS